MMDEAHEKGTRSNFAPRVSQEVSDGKLVTFSSAICGGRNRNMSAMFLQDIGSLNYECSPMLLEPEYSHLVVDSTHAMTGKRCRRFGVFERKSWPTVVQCTRDVRRLMRRSYLISLTPELIGVEHEGRYQWGHFNFAG
jgi:hypothetical protein